MVLKVWDDEEADKETQDPGHREETYCEMRLAQQIKILDPVVELHFTIIQYAVCDILVFADIRRFAELLIKGSVLRNHLSIATVALQHRVLKQEVYLVEHPIWTRNL